MIFNTIKEDLEFIIQNPNYQHLPKHFLYPKSLIENAILFIGINPSSSSDQIPLDSYSLEQRNNKHPYFKKFEDISEYCKTTWTHLDLLLFRETNQDKIYDILKQEHGVDFIFKQLKIADKLIQKSKPKVIVVSNALAATFLGRDKQGDKDVWLDYNFKFDFDLGTYLWDKTPVFFSGMLTGQRALDKGSYERLKWQIRRAIIELTKKELETLHTDKLQVVQEKQYEWAAKLRDRETYLKKYLADLDFKSDNVSVE